MQSPIPNLESPIALAAFDLDGTIVNEHFTISPRVMSALQAAKAAGVRVTIATGRPVSVTRPFARLIGVNAPVISLQGGLVYDLDREQALRAISLPHALACELIDVERAHPQWQVVAYLDDRMLLTGRRYPDAFYHSLLGDDLWLASDVCGALDGREPGKVLYIIEPQDAPAIVALLQRLVGDQATVVQSHARFVEVNPLEANKGAALAWLARYFDIPRGRVMAVGDQDNDTTMIAWAGVGVAMGNGSPAALAVADWIAPGIQEDGAAAAIERFVLRPSPPAAV
jgi:Cof subfamily protein (haloacid dehalogenase superfamily)